MPAAYDHTDCAHPRSRASSALHAFTLIEHLVAVCIIAVLSTLLIAVVGTVRSSARQVQCASNLRQIGTLVLAHLVLENPDRTAQQQTPTNFRYCYIGYCWRANYQRGDVPGIARNRWSPADYVIASDLSFPDGRYIGSNHVSENGDCRGGNTLTMDGRVAWKRFADMSWKMNYHMDLYFWAERRGPSALARCVVAAPSAPC